jgi:hypothetical protein
LVLDVDGATGRVDGGHVLIADRVLALGDGERPASGRRVARRVGAAPHGARDLHGNRAALWGDPLWKGEIVAGVDSGPRAVVPPALARLVPALHEVVVDVGDRGPSELDVDVVCVARLAGRMAGLRKGGAVQVDAADEGGLALAARVDEPALLVVAELSGEHVPAGQEARAPLAESPALGLGAGEVGARRLGLQLGRAPEAHAHVEAARDRAVEEVEEASPAVGQLEALLQEGDGHPDRVPRGLDRPADGPEGRLPVDEREDPVAGAQRVAPALDVRNVVGVALNGLLPLGRS